MNEGGKEGVKIIWPGDPDFEPPLEVLHGASGLVRNSKWPERKQNIPKVKPHRGRLHPIDGSYGMGGIGKGRRYN